MRIGELVETGSAECVAESFELNRPPELGSLVTVDTGEGDSVYAVVTYGTTAGVDPGRRAVRRSSEDVYDAAIYQEHPQLQQVLRTEFRMLLVGCRIGGTLRQHLPPQPPPLHYSVHRCEAEELRTFTNRLLYLRLLLAVPGQLPAEHLLSAHLRQVYRMRGRDLVWLQRAAQEVAGLLKQDVERLLVVLQGIDPGQLEGA